MGVKAGVEPLALWEAVRTGATQGHAACHGARPRAGRANAACQYGIRRDDGGAQSGLGEPRQSVTRAAPARTVWSQGRS
jgi:hypothetical protein